MADRIMQVYHIKYCHLSLDVNWALNLYEGRAFCSTRKRKIFHIML